MFLTLAGCGGGGGGDGDAQPGIGDDSEDDGADAPDPVDPVDPLPLESALNIATAAESAAYYDTLLPDFSAVRDAAMAPDATIFATMPTLGTVTYSGYMNLIMANTSASANVTGEATLTASFGTGAISGSATDFLGATTDEYDSPQVAHYTGTVAISNGSIFAGTDGTTDLDMDISGTLDNGLNVFEIEGNLEGGFNGPNAEGLTGLGSNTGIHGSVSATIDGAPGTIASANISAVSP